MIWRFENEIQQADMRVKNQESRKGSAAVIPLLLKQSGNPAVREEG